MADKLYTKTWVRVTLICALGAAVISGGAAVIAALLGKAQTPSAPPFPERSDIMITSPVDGEAVDRTFTIRGRTESIENRNVHVWAAVEIGNLIWIKEPELRVEDETWKAGITEGGSPPPDGFSLVLVGVENKGRDYIMQWITECKRTGSWAGINIDNIPDAVILDRVEGLKFK